MTRSRTASEFSMLSAGSLSIDLSGRVTSTWISIRSLPEPELYQQFIEQHNYQSAIRRIMALADEGNRYIDEHEPWQLN